MDVDKYSETIIPRAGNCDLCIFCRVVSPDVCMRDEGMCCLPCYAFQVPQPTAVRIVLDHIMSRDIANGVRDKRGVLLVDTYVTSSSQSSNTDDNSSFHSSISETTKTHEGVDFCHKESHGVLFEFNLLEVGATCDVTHDFEMTTDEFCPAETSGNSSLVLLQSSWVGDHSEFNSSGIESSSLVVNVDNNSTVENQVNNMESSVGHNVSQSDSYSQMNSNYVDYYSSPIASPDDKVSLVDANLSSGSSEGDVSSVYSSFVDSPTEVEYLYTPPIESVTGVSYLYSQLVEPSIDVTIDTSTISSQMSLTSLYNSTALQHLTESAIGTYNASPIATQAKVSYSQTSSSAPSTSLDDTTTNIQQTLNAIVNNTTDANLCLSSGSKSMSLLSIGGSSSEVRNDSNTETGYSSAQLNEDEDSSDDSSDESFSEERSSGTHPFDESGDEGDVSASDSESDSYRSCYAIYVNHSKILDCVGISSGTVNP